MKQSPHLYSILIRRKCLLYVLKIYGCIIIILMLIRSCLYARREHSPKAPSFVFSNYHIGFDDAEEELKRMEEFRKAQAEIEQKKEKPMSQKMFKVV